MVEFDDYTFHLQSLSWTVVESEINFQQLQEIVLFPTSVRPALRPDGSPM
jgi:hypothetical protein